MNKWTSSYVTDTFHHCCDFRLSTLNAISSGSRENQLPLYFIMCFDDDDVFAMSKTKEEKKKL